MTIEQIFTMTAGDRVRKAMKDRGVSVEQLAAELEVSRATISALVNDRKELDRRTALALQVVLGVDAELLQHGLDSDIGQLRLAQMLVQPLPKYETAPAVAGAVQSVRPEGLEPPTFCSVVWAPYVAAFALIRLASRV